MKGPIYIYLQSLSVQRLTGYVVYNISGQYKGHLDSNFYYACTLFSSKLHFFHIKQNTQSSGMHLVQYYNLVIAINTNYYKPT